MHSSRFTHFPLLPQNIRDGSMTSGAHSPGGQGPGAAATCLGLALCFITWGRRCPSVRQGTCPFIRSPSLHNQPTPSDQQPSVPGDKALSHSPKRSHRCSTIAQWNPTYVLERHSEDSNAALYRVVSASANVITGRTGSAHGFRTRKWGLTPYHKDPPTASTLTVTVKLR